MRKYLHPPKPSPKIHLHEVHKHLTNLVSVYELVLEADQQDTRAINRLKDQAANTIVRLARALELNHRFPGF